MQVVFALDVGMPIPADAKATIVPDLDTLIMAYVRLSTTCQSPSADGRSVVVRWQLALAV